MTNHLGDSGIMKSAAPMKNEGRIPTPSITLQLICSGRPENAKFET
jgi:hypothetical protein